MLLADLDPHWVCGNIFAFRCPRCLKVWLTCKNIVMGNKQQRELVAAAGLEPTGPRYGAVLMEEGCAWVWTTTDFATMSVSPSIDASKSGHWHGHIKNGQIQP